MRQGGESLWPAVIPSALAVETWLGDRLKDVGGCSARIDAFSGSLWAVGTSFDVKVEGVSESKSFMKRIRRIGDIIEIEIL